METLTLPHDIAGARFSDPADFAAFLRGPCAVSPYLTGKAEGGAWYGATPAETLARADAGNAKLTAPCDRLLSRMESVDFATSRFVTVSAVAGGAPCVPAYLAGSPMAMRRRVRIADDMAPLAVVVDVGVSASVSHPTIQRRGAAALALVRLLATTRPVSLWVVSGQVTDKYDTARNAAFAVRVDTAPLDVARAAWLLAAPEAFRRAGFAACHAIAGVPDKTDVNWLQDSHDRHPSLLRDCLPALTACADFLLVPSLITAGETQFDSDESAAAWVQAQLDKHGGAAMAA
jgi:hypothetical protein